MLCKAIFFFSAIVCCTRFASCEDESLDFTGIESIDGSRLVNQAAAINSLILTKSPVYSVEENLAVVTDEYKALLAKNHPDDDYFKAVKLVASLTTIKWANQCQEYTVNLLKQLDSLTSHRAMNEPSLTQNPTRLEKIVALYSTQNCQLFCLYRYKSRVAHLDKIKKNQVDRIMDTYCRREEGSNNLIKGVKWFRLATKLSKGQVSDDFAVRLVEDLTKSKEDLECLRGEPNEFTGRPDIDTTKVLSLYDRLLSEPCNYYVDQMGPGLFDVLDYYSKWQYTTSLLESEFHKGFAAYELCQLVKNYRNVLTASFKINN